MGTLASVVEAQGAPYDATVTPSEGTARRDIRNSLTVGVAIALFSIGSFAFYLVAGRALGPDAYGLAAALQNVIVVAAMPLIALQWATARLVASSTGDARRHAMASYRRLLIRASIVGVVVTIVAIGVTIGIGAAHAGTPVEPLCLTYVAILMFVPGVISLGTLQGEDRYTGFAASYASTGVLRAPILLPLLAIPLLDKVSSTVLSVAAATAIGAVIALWLTRRELRVTDAPDPDVWRGFTRALPPIVVGLTGIAVLANVDVVAAKLSLGGTAAGLFGAAAVIAKALMVIPAALTTVLLPRVAAREAEGKPTGSLLAAGILVMFLAGLLAIAVIYPFENTVIDIAFGAQYEGAAPLLIPFLGATTLLGALLILVNHHVGRGDHRFVWAVGGLAIVQLVLLTLFSATGNEIIAVDAIVAGLGLVIHEVIYFNSDDSMLRGAGAQFRTIARKLTNRGEDAA